MVATTLLRNIRRSDMVFRYGGEEIVILLEGDDRQTLTTAERLRDLIAHSSIYYQEQHLSITMTVGAAVMKGK